MGEKARNRKIRRRSARKAKQQSTSIYFLLWATFTAFSLVIVLLLSISQAILLAQSYRREAALEMSQKGREIQHLVLSEPPKPYEGNKSLYLRMLSTQYDVHIFILNDQGEVLFPQMIDGENATFDFSEEIVELKNKLQGQDSRVVVFESNRRYIYGAEITQYDQTHYLYVEKSLELVLATSTQMRGRGILVAIFTFVFSFAVSSAVSAWLIRPISEMTFKAKKLANGDFNVDFHGADYGREMVDLAEMLNYARDELSKADTMQKQLIANVSHDFKTPLTMIKAYASMIVEISGDNKEKREKHAQIIVDEADRLTSLVNDVLALSKMRAGLEELKMTDVDMSSYLYEILSRFDYLKETQGYHFDVEIEDGLFTRGDELKLGQALYNLIGNAVNYTGDDKCVFVSLKRTDKGLFRFTVKDTGEGIKPEERAEIWRRYYRSSETHKRPVKGTGLGLSIVKTVLDQHQFVCGVESEEGQGSAFFVDFPLIEEAPNA